MNKRMNVDETAISLTTEVEDAHAFKWIRRAAWTLGATMVALLCVFDLGPPLTFNDDWGFAWSVRHLDWLHLHLYPSSSALALPQIVWGWLASGGQGDQRLLRLSVVPLVLLAMWMLYRLARLAGANKTWSVLAALAPLAFPVFSADATTFMSDVPYVALLLVAAYGAVRWANEGGKRWVALCVAFAILATLQRQVGVLIPVAVTALMWLRPHGRAGWSKHDWVGLVLLWVGCVGAIVLPSLTGVAPPTQGTRITAALALQPLYFRGALEYLPGMLGLALVPFLPGLALGLGRDRDWSWAKRWLLWLVIVDLVVYIWYLILARSDYTIFPGNVFSRYGFASAVSWYQMGLKPYLFTLPVFGAIQILAADALLAFAVRLKAWWPGRRQLPGMALLLLAVTQFFPLGLVHYIPYDRYYLPAALLLVPLAARAASKTRMPILAACVALALVAAGAVIYIVGEQDYQAWQVARNNAACLAYQYALPGQVYAGYEAMAVYVEIPYYEQHGVILGGAAISTNPTYFSLTGPTQPVLSVRFAPSNDPRPGYNYSSLASAKLVVAIGVNGPGLPIPAPTGTPACPLTK